MKTKKISVVGPINADILAIANYRGNWREDFEWASAADISLCVAGSSGYTLQDFQKLGSDARIFASIGGDGIGAALKEEMQRVGINIDYLTTHPSETTAIGVYWLMHGNKKRPLAYQTSKFSPWPTEWDKATEDALLDADLLHCGGYLHYPEMYFGKTTELFKKAKQRGVITSVDTQFPLMPEEVETPWIKNMTDILPYIDVLIMDEQEAQALVGAKDADQAAEMLLCYNIKVLVIKFGKNGSRIYANGYIIHQPAIDIGQTVDSIGAGDAFGAAFMTYYMDGKSIKECAHFASVVAGFTVTQAGGIKGMPDRVAAEKYISNNTD